jgi:nitrate/nitrite-specific signal transduction histidine kinase
MCEPKQSNEVVQSLSDALRRLQPWMDAGLEPLLQAAVDYARELVHASFAGIIILEPQHPSAVRYFKVSGWNSTLGELPKGHGMYFLPAITGHSLRVESVAEHPLSIGTPSGHPPIESLLAIPLRRDGQSMGCMFFGKPPKAGAFTKNDEEIMIGFASLCAVAISWCDQRDEDRSRIAAEERRKIKEELHDSLSQTLFAVAREIDRLEQVVPGAEEKDELKGRIARLRELTNQCQSELRAILFRLTDDDAKPNITALTRLVEEFERVSGISTQLITHGDFSRLSRSVQEIVFKVVSESLANIYRHANSPFAVVHVRVDADVATVAVQDAGKGISDEALRFMAHPTGHFGLYSMARSIAMLNGKLDIFRNDDGGTTVRCTFPIHGNSNSEQGTNDMNPGTLH